jgi:hypothetical protein
MGPYLAFHQLSRLMSAKVDSSSFQTLRIQSFRNLLLAGLAPVSAPSMGSGNHTVLFAQGLCIVGIERLGLPYIASAVAAPYDDMYS